MIVLISFQFIFTFPLNTITSTTKLKCLRLFNSGIFLLPAFYVLAHKVGFPLTLQLKPWPVVRWWVGIWSTSLKAILLHTSWLLLYPLLLLYQFNNLVRIHSLIYLSGQQFQRVLHLTRRSPS